MKTIQEIVEENFKGLDDLMVDKELVTWYKSLIMECIRMYAEDVVDEVYEKCMCFECPMTPNDIEKFKQQLK